MFGKIRKLIAGESAASNDPSAGPYWETQTIAGRTADVLLPEDGAEPAGLVLFLHGHAGITLRGNPVFTAELAKHRLACICPHGDQAWWLPEIVKTFDPDQTSHEWITEALLPALQEKWSISPPRIALMGVSTGGQGALQLAYRHARTFPVVTAISPAVDFHQLYGQGLPIDEAFRDKEAARQATVVLNLHPLSWPRFQYFCCDPADTDWFDGCSRLAMKLSSSGILHERDLETSAGGHSWAYFNHMAPQVIGFIASSLATASAV